MKRRRVYRHYYIRAAQAEEIVTAVKRWRVLYKVEENLKVIDMLFGCLHKHTSFPMSGKPGQRRSPAAALTGSYVVCLDCGKEFSYDWEQMRIVSSVREVTPARASVEVEVNS